MEEKGNRPAIIAITEEELSRLVDRAALAGAEAGIRKYTEEMKIRSKKRADRRLRNTKLLLRNYHMLKENAENSVFGRTQIGESAADILESMMNMYDNEIIIESIRKSATRTAIIVSHIEVMLGIYQAYCERATDTSLEMRRYNVIYDRYIADDTKNVAEISEKYGISKESVYSDVNIATERLSALIFGIDGLSPK